MANPTYISCENLSADGNLTVPVNCTFIVAMSYSDLTSISIGGVAMDKAIGGYGSIFTMIAPGTGTKAADLSANVYTVFAYFYDAGSCRAGAATGTSGSGNYAPTIDSSATDTVVGVMGCGGPGNTPGLKAHSSNMSIIDSAADRLMGYLAAVGATEYCQATNDYPSGTSSGAFASIVLPSGGHLILWTN